MLILLVKRASDIVPQALRLGLPDDIWVSRMERRCGRWVVYFGRKVAQWVA